MKKKSVVLIFTLLLNLLISTTFGSSVVNNNGKLNGDNFIDTIYVDSKNTMGPWDGTIENPYRYINQAIENSSTYYNILVKKGEYFENIIIDKQIKIIGEDKNTTIINGNYEDDVIKILSENVSIQGFTIKNSRGYNQDAGIKIITNYIKISDCNIYRTRHAIIFQNSINSRIINCLIHTNGEGVLLENCNNCEIINSEFCNNAIGLNIYKSQFIKIIKSYFHENGIGVFMYNSGDIKIIDNAICDNNNNQGGCFIFNSQNIKIYNSNIIHNGLAFRIDDSKDIIIEKCTFRFNAHYCTYLKKNVKNFTISKCEIYGNLRYAIYIKNGECTVENNNMYQNWIDSCHLKQGVCNARFNYWGSKFGPFINGVKIVDLFRIKTDRINLFPWLIKPLKNTGANWNVEDFFTKTKIIGYGDGAIILTGEDSDGDGVPDWWEAKWGYNPLFFDNHKNIDEDKDGLNNFEECYTDKYESNPYQKDVFLEIDWIETARTSGIKNLPSEENINNMKARFAEHEINLHVDVGQLDGGEEIPYKPRFKFDDLIDIYWDYFLHNDLSNPRKNIFHYALVCDEGPSTGFEFIGWAHCNALCISSEILKLLYSDYTYQRLIILGVMHELGHTFGLFSDDFGGNDNRAAVEPFYKDYYIYSDYKSVMNYRYFLSILDYSDGNNGSVDFDDWGNLDYSFFKNSHFDWSYI